MTPRFVLSADLQTVVRPAVLVAEGATIVAPDPGLDGGLAATEARLRDAGPPEDVIAAVRAMYRRVGLDPTKRRPSSESLLRRVRRGEALPRINTAVDVGNWCSVETQLPFGVYDLARVTGDVALRVGRDGEEYAGIGKEVVHVGGRLVLSDDAGAFGNPSSDSARTMVTSATTRLLVVIYVPANLDAAAGARAAVLTAERLRDHTRADVASVHVDLA